MTAALVLNKGIKDFFLISLKNRNRGGIAKDTDTVRMTRIIFFCNQKNIIYGIIETHTFRKGKSLRSDLMWGSPTHLKHTIYKSLLYIIPAKWRRGTCSPPAMQH